MLEKKYILKSLLLSMSTCIFVACGGNIANEYKCRETKIVTEFPTTINLEEGKLLKINPFGSVDMFGIDSLLVFQMFNQNHFWKVVNLNNLKEECYLLGKGHGKNEFSSLPVSVRPFATDTDSYCDFYDYNSKTFYRCNLTQSLKQGSPCFEMKEEINSSDQFLDLYRLSDNEYFAVKPIAYNGFCRGLLTEKGFTPCEGLGNLNEMIMEENYNTIASARNISPSVDMIVEPMIRLRQINLYSISGEKSLTLSIDGELQDALKVERTPKKLLSKTFMQVACYKDYFMAVYLNSSILDFSRGKTSKSHLLVFDWEGNPLAKINVPYEVSNTYIYNNKLYILSANDEVYQYDAPQIMYFSSHP